jgi:hypothetical protein
VAALLLFAAAAAPAGAQYANNPYRNYSTNPFVNANLRLSFQKSWRANHLRLLGRGGVADRMEGRGNRASANPGREQVPVARPSRALPRAPLSATSFAPAGPPVMPHRLAEKLTQLSREQRAEMASFFGELLRLYEAQAGRGQGHPPGHNVAGALAYMVAAGHFVAEGGELGDAGEEELVRNLNDVLAGLDEFKRLGATEKQQVYEAAVISGGFLLAMLQQAREEGDEAKAAQARQLAKELLRDFFGGAAE